MPQKKVSATIQVTAVIDGQDGQPGAEGNGIQSVARTYAVSSQATTASDTTPPSDITTWAAASPATTEAKPYLWAKEVVTYTKAASTTKYYMIGARGQNGIDAQDFEWAYIRTKTNTAPVIAADSSYTDSKGKTYTADDHLPHVTGNSNIESDNSGVSGKTYECTDDPKGVNDDWPYEWEIKREKGAADANGHRAWQPYSGTMTLHNNLAASLLTIDIDNDSDQFGVDADGKVLAQQARSTVVTMAYGTELQVFTVVPTASLRYDDGTPVDTSVATAAVSDVSPSDAANTQYRVTVTVKETGSNTPVFGTSGKNGLYVDISGTCARGTKTIRFSLAKVMGGANPVIWQLNPSKKSFVFGRDASNNLTPPNVASNIYVTRTEGNTTTEHTSTSGLTNPPTFSWGFDTETTAQTSGQAIGTAISISNSDAASHSSVWVKLSTGDRETLPILKDGAKGADPVVLSLRCSAAVVSFKENSGTVTCSPETYRLSLERTEGETTTVLSAVPSGYSLKYNEDGSGWVDGQTLGELNAASEFIDGSVSEISYGLFKGDTLMQKLTVTAEWPEKGDKGADAVVYSLQCSPAAVNFRSNAVGEFSGSYTVGCKVMKTVGNNTMEVAASGGTYDGMYLKCRRLNISGNYTSWVADSSATLTPSDALTNNYVAVEFALSANSGMTAVKARVSVPIMCDGHRGAQGEPGATGKMFYPMGEWNATTVYSRTGDLVPLVFLPDPGHYNEKIEAEGNYFYLYDDTNTGTRPVINDSTNPWRLCNDFGVVITQGLFAEYAKLGKGIFCGDFLFSMNGYIGDVEYADGAYYGSLPAYTRFNTMFPYGKGIVDIEQILTVCTQEEVQGFVTDYVPLTKAFKLLDGDTYIIRVRGYVSNSAYDGHLCLTTKKQQGYTEDLYVGGCKNTTETEIEFTFNNAVADEYQISAIITYNGNITSWSTPTANFTQPSSNQIIVYKWATSTPAKPTGTSSTPSGWSRYIPAQPDNNYTLYASYGTKAVSSGAFYITSIEIECTVSTAFKPVWWVDLRTGKMSAARGNFVVEANGNVMIDGVIRSRNLYRNVCIFMDGGRYSSDWWYVAQITDGTPAGLKVGDYFTGAFPDPAHDTYDGMIRCAYGADTIIMVPVVPGYKWQYNTAVMLPDPTTFDGKTVEILCKADGANSGIKILVGCVVSDAFGSGYYDIDMQYPSTSSRDTLKMTPKHCEAMYSFSGASIQQTGYKVVFGKMVLYAENGKWTRIE